MGTGGSIEGILSLQPPTWSLSTSTGNPFSPGTSHVTPHTITNLAELQSPINTSSNWNAPLQDANPTDGIFGESISELLEPFIQECVDRMDVANLPGGDSLSDQGNNISAGGYLEGGQNLPLTWDLSTPEGNPITSRTRRLHLCLLHPDSDEPHNCKLHVLMFNQGKREKHIHSSGCVQKCGVKYKDMEGIKDIDDMKETLILHIEDNLVKDESGRDVARVRDNGVVLGKTRHNGFS